MQTIPPAKAKLFRHGRSQAVRLPKEFRFDGEEVYVRRMGDEVVLSARPRPAIRSLVEALDEFEDGFEIEREQPGSPDSREPLLARGRR